MYEQLIAAAAIDLVLLWVVRSIRGFRAESLLLVAVTALYAAAIVCITLLCGGRCGQCGVCFELKCPIIEAIRLRHYGLSTNRSVLNILLFVPLGFLLSSISTHCLSSKRSSCSSFSRRFISHPQNGGVLWCLCLCVVLGLTCSLAVEVCQLVFHRGVFELDDLVKNTLGAVVGYLLFVGMDLVSPPL